MLEDIQQKNKIVSLELRIHLIYGTNDWKVTVLLQFICEGGFNSTAVVSALG